MKKRIIIILIILALVVGLGLFISSYLNKQRNTLTINLSIAEGSTLNLYNLYENSSSADSAYEFKTSGQYKVERNNYDYILSFDNPDYQKQTGLISIKDQKIDLNLQKGGYSSEKLQVLLANELPLINQTINNKYPDQLKSYQLEEGRLYLKGEWFGGKLIKKDSVEYSDKYLVVLKKENGNWQVVVTPDLALSSDVYPDIPKEVLSGVNILN